ncbi:MAG: DUF6798 domain-containing protein [Sedimenticolaceae bacterium]
MHRTLATGRTLTKILGEVALYVFVIFVSSYDFGQFGVNEVNKLAAAKHFAQPGWLANDWYLGLETARYEVFNWIAGPLVSYLGFAGAAVAGRLICYLALGFAFYRLRNSLRLPWYGMLLVLALFFAKQSFVAGEWMAGGFEAKSLAYAALLLAIAAYSRAAYAAGAAWAGAAVSLHPLIGAYGTLCLGGAILLAPQARRPHFVRLFVAQWPFVVTGAFGMAAIAAQLLAGAGADGMRAAWIYVHFRNPHHLLPEFWATADWKWASMLAPGLLSSLIMAVAPNVGRIRILAGFVAGTSIIFCVGIAAWVSDMPSMLKYYPFRLADTFVPLWLLVLAVWVIARRSALRRLLGSWSVKRRPVSLDGPVLLLAVAFLAWFTLTQVPDPVTRIASSLSSSKRPFVRPPMFEWIAAHTEPGAVLLVPPAESAVYLYAERATVATFKHAPHSGSGVIQWYERITDLNGGKVPSRHGFAAQQEISERCASLSESDVVALSTKYAATHMLTTDETDYHFERLHAVDGWVLYRLGDTLD